jgi:hypothetical protein
MKFFLGIILFVSNYLFPINSNAKELKTIEIYELYKNTINACLQRDLTLEDGKTAICFPAFGKSKEDAYKNMFRYQSILGNRLSLKTTWVTTESGFTFQKRKIKDKIIVTYIDPYWDGCAKINDITYCEFRLIQEEAKDNQVAQMMSLIGFGGLTDPDRE